MNDQWIEIFKGGRQTDAQGSEHDGDDLIRKAVDTFDPKFHEPPVVIGHPKHNEPAFGWVKELKQKGPSLFARLGGVVPEFADMVQRGLFKKRSASFYADGRLRHVGFLGAAPPAVKGLADVAFEDKPDALVFEFTDAGHKFGVIARILRGLREFLISRHDEETADNVVDNFDIDFLKEPEPAEEAESSFADPKPTEDDMTGKPQEGKQPEEKSKTFTEEDLQKAREEERKKAEAEFKEQGGKDDNDRVLKLEQQLTQERDARRKDGIHAFCDKLKDAGQYPPAFDSMGLREFLESLPHEEPVVEFTEGDKQVKKTPLEFMQGFLQNLPKTVVFNEISGGDGPEPGEEKDRLIADFQEKNPKATYKEAALAVAEKHPTLFN